MNDDPCTLARARLADGRHVSDGDVARLCTEIERLRQELARAQAMECNCHV